MNKPPLKNLWEYWAKSQSIPEEALDEWIADPSPAWHCLFCGKHGTKEAFTLTSHYDKASVFGCFDCGEYKGVEPCIPGVRMNHSPYCPWGK